MGSFKDDDKLGALRERLYARGSGSSDRSKFRLKDEPKQVSSSWQNPPNSGAAKSVDGIGAASSASDMTPAVGENVAYTPPDIAPMAQKKRSKKYRLYIVLAALLFFIGAVGVSSLFFFLGGNTISGENIAIDISGPFTIGGGEAIPLQVGVTNQNTVDIQSATLIVTYPSGTQSATEEGKEIFVERMSLESIGAGQTLNIPLRAIVFGEENEEKVIEATIEYRVAGSNSTFEKDAEPLRFKISSSPVVLSVDALHKVSSGQETDIVLTVTSNSPNPLTDVIVRAEYPTGFDYTTADPQLVSGQNVWRIDSLPPEGETTITIKGMVIGRETDEYAMHFSIGVPANQDRLTLASVFSTASTEFLIEQPFIDVQLKVNGDDSGTVSTKAGERVRVDVLVGNTLSDTIYDGRVELTLSGNALSDYDVEEGSGFYDSRNNTVLWDSASIDSLREIAPGRELSFSISLTPDPDIKSAPQLAFDVDVRARRVTEGNVTEELIGTAASVAKVTSVATLESEAGRDTSTWGDIGPLPPVAEEETTYTITFFTQNGTNDIGDTEVSATLPPYVEWLNQTSGAGKITFNETSRTVTWNVGSVDANQSKIASFQVSLLPSISQIGTTPTLVGDQHLRATDRFTGAVVRTTRTALTTRLSEEAGYPQGIGEVQKAE